MERLLGPHVKFYTQVYTPAQCVDDERKALKKYPDFKVYIASGIDVLKTGENAVKASYTIHTSHGGKSKTHNAYLRLNRIDGRWYIAAVSDETTDSRPTSPPMPLQVISMATAIPSICGQMRNTMTKAMH